MIHEAQARAVNDSPLHLFHVFPGFGVGGAQSRLLQLLQGAPGRYRHTILSLNGLTEMAARISAELPVAVTGFSGSKTSSPWNWSRHRAHIRQARPDVLVTYNWGAMDWCISNRISPLARHVHIEDGFGPEEASGQMQRRIWTRRLALTGSNSTVVVPSCNLERIAREMWKIPAHALKYIPNGIDCMRFRRAQRHAGPLRIGTVATLRPEKNLGRLIALFEEFAGGGGDAQLVIVGDGAERAVLEARAGKSRCADRIVFTGASRNPELELEHFDIFALTSDTEQMPLSVLEAMAAGLPVLSFAVGDVPRMVAETNRPYAAIAPSNDAAWLEGLHALAGSGALRQQLGDANQTRARAHFDQKLMLERYIELFG